METLNTNTPDAANTKTNARKPRAVKGKVETQNPFATGPAVVIAPAKGATPANVDVITPKPTQSLPKMTIIALWGVTAIQDMLHNALSNVVEDCFLNECGIGDYHKFARYCLSLGQLVKNQAGRMGNAPEARELTRIGNAVLRLYSEGLSDNALLNMYAVLNGGFLPETFRARFTTACYDAKRTYSIVVENDGSEQSIEERRFNFDELYAQFRADLDARNQRQSEAVRGR